MSRFLKDYIEADVDTISFLQAPKLARCDDSNSNVIQNNFSHVAVSYTLSENALKYVRVLILLRTRM